MKYLKHNLLSSEREIALAKHYRKYHDEYSRNELVTHNLRLVLKIASHYQHTPVDFEDLVQAGNLGLFKAVQHFDDRLGYRFSTYATWWIRQSITRYIADNSRTVRAPVHLHELHNRYARLIKQEPNLTDAEILAKLNIKADTLTRIRAIDKSIMSLNQQVKDDAGDDASELGDLLASDVDVESDVLTSLRDQEIFELVKDALPAREWRVINLRFGLEDGVYRTLQEVGDQFGCSRENIRQIESKALRRLRSLLRERGVKDFENF